MPGTLEPAPSRTLPRLFVIGDSISLHYGPFLEMYVAGSFQYARKRDEARGSGASLDYPSGAFGENAGDSGMVLEYLRANRTPGCTMPADDVTDRGVGRARLPADVVLLNCGLHDLKTDPATARPQVALDQYRENLRAIAALVTDEPYQAVWITTTPVHDQTHAAHRAELGFTRNQADVERYNAAATAVMLEAGIPVADLHAFTRALSVAASAGIYADHVHFVDGVRQAQAAFLAGWLSGAWSGLRRS